MKPVIHASAVNEAIRSRFTREGLAAAKQVASNMTDEQITGIAEERAEITGDSERGWGFRWLPGRHP